MPLFWLSWRRVYIKISGRARTGGKYSAPTILIESFVIQAISIFLLKTCVYKNQRPGKNGRKIFRPYISFIFAPTHKDARRTILIDFFVIHAILIFPVKT